MVGKEVRKVQQKWQQRDVLVLAQVLTARGVALQQQFRWLAGNQRQQSSNGSHETRAGHKGREECSAGKFQESVLGGVGENDPCCASG